jgi:hypothetical protein
MAVNVSPAVARDTPLHRGEGTLRGWENYQQKVICVFSVAVSLSYRAPGGASTPCFRGERKVELEKKRADKSFCPAFSDQLRGVTKV